MGLFSRTTPPLAITVSCADRPRPSYPGLSVACNPDGTLTIHADAATAALLAGRRELGDVDTKQAQLRDIIADAWYAADCPPAEADR